MEITYIIPTCGFGNLKNTIESILIQSIPPFEIIVLLNGVEFKEKINAKNIRFLNLRKNYGFARACNLGIAHCKSKYFALINDDALLKKNWAEKNLKEIEKEEEIAALSSFIQRENGSIQVGSIELNVYKEAIEVPYFKEGNLINFTAVLISLNALLKVGPLEERFFSYYEDVDLSLRFLRAGFKLRVLEEPLVLHKESSSKEILKNKKNFYLFRNKNYTILRNFGFKFYFKNFLKIFRGDLKILKKNPLYFFYYPLFLFYPRPWK